jgi:type III pantothenate kinase
MILAIDVGNSTVSFGFFDEDRLAHKFTSASRANSAPDEIISFLSPLMMRAGITWSDIGSIVISSVVPSLVHVFFEAFGPLVAGSPLLVSSRLKLNVKVEYKTPDTLGGDRIAASCAAYEMSGGPVAVIDFGTATTVTVVDAEGNLTGGAIAPGLVTGYEALTSKTAGLPYAGLTFPRSAVGRTTSECIQSGLIFGHAAMADGLLKRVREEMGGRLKIIATGGLAGLVVLQMEEQAEIVPDLTLKGLKLIASIN